MKWLPWFGLAVLIVAAIPVGWFGYTVEVDRTYPRTPTTVIVPDGATGREIARLLEERGVIRSAVAFDEMARLEGRRNDLKAGEFAFPPHQTAVETLREVETGGEQVAVWVTIPEGFTAKEIAQTLAERDLGETGALEAVFLHDSLTFGDARTPTLEGYLFPDTYLIPTVATPAEIAKIMTGQFLSELPRDASSQAKRLGYSIPQIVTLASLVEREAKADDERALMAGVYYNRLRLGMPLEVDATSRAIRHTTPTNTRGCRRRPSPILGARPCWLRFTQRNPSFCSTSTWGMDITRFRERWLNTTPTSHATCTSSLRESGGRPSTLKTATPKSKEKSSFAIPCTSRRRTGNSTISKSSAWSRTTKTTALRSHIARPPTNSS